MDVAEELTQRFITCNGLAKSGFAVTCPQFELVREDGWKTNFDFLVLDFGRETGCGRIIVVEVSDGYGLGSAGEKADCFLTGGYRAFTEAAIDKLTHGLTAEWPVFFLGIVRDARAVEIGNARYHGERWIRFMSLGQFVSGDSWETRAEGLSLDEGSCRRAKSERDEK